MNPCQLRGGYMLSFSRIFSVAVAIVLAAQVMPGQTATLAVSPSTKTVNISDALSIDVTVNTVTGLHAANVRIVFNSAVLHYSGVTLGSFLPGAFLLSPLLSPGLLNIDTLTVDQAILGTGASTGFGTIFTVQFTAQGSGTTPIQLQSGSLRTSGNTDIPYTAVHGEVIVDPPLPITLSSFTIGMTAGNSVLLNWKTISEINNFGFSVQRRSDKETAFADLPNSFVAGHGTTDEMHVYSYVDPTAGAGMWHYRLKQTDLDGLVHFTESLQLIVSSMTDGISLPGSFELDQNYPNPFNPTTTIRYMLPQAAHVTLTVHTILGEQVDVLVSGEQESGVHEIRFDGSQFVSGVYFYTLHAGNVVTTRKLALVK